MSRELRSTKILGIDPGIATTGWGVVRLRRMIKNERLKMKNRGLEMIDYGVIKTKASLSMPRRLFQVYEQIADLIQGYQPDLVAIEEVFFGANAKTAMMVGQAKGVVILAAVNAKVEVVEFTPLQIKVAVTGYGRAEKKQMQKMVARLLGLEKIPRPDDPADALAVALTAAVSRGNLPEATAGLL